MATSNRLDMSLDAIIALDKKKANKGSARGRGASRGRGRGRAGGRTRGASATPTRGRGRGRGRPFTPTSRPTGLRGARGGTRGRGRGRGRVTSQRGRGTTVQGLRSAQSQAIATQRKAARTAINDARRNISANSFRGGGRGRGRGFIVRPTSVSSSGRGRGRGGAVRGGGRNLNPRAKQVMANASVARARRTLAGRNRQGGNTTPRGRGRGAQGGRRGRGGSNTRGDNQRPQTQNVQIEVKQNVKPEGVLLSPDFGASHHTQVSLDNRFTPRNISTQPRVVMSNGRSVAYQS